MLLKWPNDLLLGGAKLAGILLERSDHHIVAGFGVNLAVAPRIEGKPTAALAAYASLTPQAFVPLLAASMARMLSLWRDSPPRAFSHAWLARAHLPGTPLTVHDRPGHSLTGRFEGLEPDGALRLRLDDGRVETIRAGDVALD